MLRLRRVKVELTPTTMANPSLRVTEGMVVVIGGYPRDVLENDSDSADLKESQGDRNPVP
jgi:hypothetical protein